MIPTRLIAAALALALLPLTARSATYYADSVNGLDSNPGTSAAPFKTLARVSSAATAAGNGTVLNLVRASYWRESLDLGTLTGCTVQAVGTGAAPLIDGAAVVTAWTKTTGRTNVYQASVTHDGTATNRLTAYENGALLIRVADQATCDSTPGSFVDAKGSDGSPLTMYIHATGDGNPATNGGLYEVSVRTIGFRGGANTTLSGIQTMRTINNNGSVDLVDTASCVVSQCLGLWGTKHTLGFGDGAAQDCVVLYADPPTSYELSNTAYVAFRNDGTGRTFAAARMGAIGRYPTFNEYQDWYSHGAVNPLASFQLTQCWAVNYALVGFGNATGCYWKNAYALNYPGVLSQCILNVSDHVSVLDGTTSSDCVFFMQDAGRMVEVFRPNNTNTLSRCALSGLTGYTSWFNNGGTGALTVNSTVVDGGINLLALPTGCTYTGDYNVFRATNPYAMGNTVFFNYHGANVTTLSAWQSSTGQDAHSVYFLTSDQTAGNAYAFWLAYRNAASGTDLTTVGPGAGDWRINPGARVYAANGTAYTGTFPDGTAITTAGPQNRWNWQKRASEAGTVTAYPNVPQTLAQSQAYIANPAAWVFNTVSVTVSTRNPGGFGFGF